MSKLVDKLVKQIEQLWLMWLWIFKGPLSTNCQNHINSIKIIKMEKNTTLKSRDKIASFNFYII